MNKWEGRVGFVKYKLTLVFCCCKVNLLTISSLQHPCNTSASHLKTESKWTPETSLISNVSHTLGDIQYSIPIIRTLCVFCICFFQRDVPLNTGINTFCRTIIKLLSNSVSVTSCSWYGIKSRILGTLAEREIPKGTHSILYFGNILEKISYRTKSFMR